MTGPSHHAAIIAGLNAAWAADADHRPADAEAIIHDLHATYGTVEVLAIAAALHHAPSPEVRRG